MDPVNVVRDNWWVILLIGIVSGTVWLLLYALGNWVLIRWRMRQHIRMRARELAAEAPERKLKPLREQEIRNKVRTERPDLTEKRLDQATQQIRRAAYQLGAARHHKPADEE